MLGDCVGKGVLAGGGSTDGWFLYLDMQGKESFKIKKIGIEIINKFAILDRSVFAMNNDC